MTMTPTSRAALLEKARRREADATRLERSARTLLSKAAHRREQARHLYQRASGQESLPLISAHRRRRRVLLNQQTFLQALHEANLKHSEFARQLGIAPSTWSQILSGQRAVTPQMQARLLNHPLIAGRPEASLWEEAR